MNHVCSSYPLRFMTSGRSSRYVAWPAIAASISGLMSVQISDQMSWNRRPSARGMLRAEDLGIRDRCRGSRVPAPTRRTSGTASCSRRPTTVRSDWRPRVGMAERRRATSRERASARRHVPHRRKDHRDRPSRSSSARSPFNARSMTVQPDLESRDTTCWGTC